MIYINYKVLIVIILVCLSFINNLLLTFDNLKDLNKSSDLACLVSVVDPSIKVEEETINKVSLMYKYIIYFIFFYNINDPTSIKDIINSY